MHISDLKEADIHCHYTFYHDFTYTSVAKR